MGGPAAPAGSVILLREGPAGPEALIVERGRGLAFAGGHLAFPGGRVDAADRPPGMAGEAADDLAARAAALRELDEETALRPATLLAHDLMPYARWLPPAEVTHRRYDTRFFLAEAPDGATVRADGVETERAFWASPGEVLRQADGGSARLLFPTRCLLARLAQARTVAAALDEAGRSPPALIRPEIVSADGETWILIPPGIGYPYTRERYPAH